MKKIVIRISPDGKEVKHLYSDHYKHPDTDYDVERASEVFFDKESQKWMVKVLATGEIIPYKFTKRKDAIDCEVDFLNADLRARRDEHAARSDS